MVTISTVIDTRSRLQCIASIDEFHDKNCFFVRQLFVSIKLTFFAFYVTRVMSVEQWKFLKAYYLGNVFLFSSCLCYKWVITLLQLLPSSSHPWQWQYTFEFHYSYTGKWTQNWCSYLTNKKSQSQNHLTQNQCYRRIFLHIWHQNSSGCIGLSWSLIWKINSQYR